MFEDGDIRVVGQRLLATEEQPCTDAEAINRIHDLERLVAHVNAQLLAEAARFTNRRREGRHADPADRVRQAKLDAANDEVALARGVSATTAALHVSLAEILANDLPECFAALDAGRISLFAARTIVKECDILNADQRRHIDAAVAAEAVMLTPGQVREAVRARVLAADPDAGAKRAKKARADPCVGLVNRPDAVGLVFGRLPAEQATACWKAVDAEARRLRGAGDTRSLMDLRCDLFVSRLTGADPAEPARVELGIVLSAATWLGLDSAPATLAGYGAIVPEVVKDILADAECWVRRMLVDPCDGQVLTIDSRARKVTGLLRTFGSYRDRICRRPYCANPIADFNHIKPHGEGGRTTHRNIDGLCEPCHLTRHRAGWTQTAEPFSGRVWWTTPTGHTYPSDPPPALGYGTLSAAVLRMIIQHHATHPRRTAA